MKNTNDLNEKKNEQNNYYGFIYITTNNVNGKKCIGQKKYYENHETYIGSGVALKNAINKYGKENFTREIIENCKTKKELDSREKYWIEYYNATESEDFYNITSGGDGGFGSGKNSPWYGKHLSEGTKEKLSKMRSGENNPFYGKTHSDEVKKKLSEKGLKQKHSQEIKEKISKGIKENHADFSGKNNPRSRKIKQYDLSKNFFRYWVCAKDASKILSINYCSIISCCTGRYKSSGGYIWEYAD